MKFIKGTFTDCQNLVSKMDTHFGYPNLDTKTTTTSNILQIPGSAEYIASIPTTYESLLTAAEISLTITGRPSEFDAQD